jgi:peptide/nickel transport system substrate-binding protein
MEMGKSRVIALLAVTSIVAAACSTSSGSASPAASTGTAPSVAPVTASAAPSTAAAIEVYPRAETLYTTGKQWGAPVQWNPLDAGNMAMGVFGLQYEPLYMYDPLKDVYTPWLATGDIAAGWDSSKTTYTIHVRSGVKWSDGSDFTSADVALTILLAKNPALGSNLWTTGGVTAADATDASTVVVKFTNPAYQEWAQWLYNSPIVPKAVFEAKNTADILKFTNANGVGTGPYMYKTAAADRMVWVKNPNWWATAALKLEVKPKYIVDIVNSSNNVALGQLLQGGVDLSNNYFPGVKSIVDGGYGVTTYFPGVPYMLGGNTATLIPNTAKKPLDDPAFRKALAMSIDTNDIVTKVYGSIVTVADPTGLLPNFSKYIDAAQVKSLGFTFDTAKAKSMLATAGYKTVGGFVTNKDGSPIKLTLEVPDGWSDWMQAENSIATSAAKAGIKIDPQHPDFNTVVAHRNRADAKTPATFDLQINNDVQIGNTPWTWYDYVFRQPLPFGTSENRNYEGYSNAAAWTLVQKLDNTPIEDVAAIKTITSALQKIQLTDTPVIPLWYNGIWAQMNNTVWTNWPSSTGDGRQLLPATWNGYWNMGAVLMLTQITAVPPAK